jgi:hypothetical protein
MLVSEELNRLAGFKKYQEHTLHFFLLFMYVFIYSFFKTEAKSWRGKIDLILILEDLLINVWISYLWQLSGVINISFYSHEILQYIKDDFRITDILGIIKWKYNDKKPTYLKYIVNQKTFCQHCVTACMYNTFIDNISTANIYFIRW